MSLKHAILGFLSYRPLSGYELKKGFDRSVRHFWPANQSQIYRTLSQLDEEGLVEKEVVEREERLDMKIYNITETGRSELHQWLSTPLPELDNREPFLIQVFFGGPLSDDEIIHLMQAKLRSIEERLTVYKAIHQASQGNPPSIQNQRAFFLSMLTLEIGHRSDQTSAEWLKSAIQRIQNKNYTITIPEESMNKTVRNIIIVGLFSVGGGWLGIWLNQVTGNVMPPLQSLGALVWLTTPALSGFFLRAFGGDGWKDAGFGLNLRTSWKWYLVAILVYPLAALLVFGLAALLGAVSADGFAAQGVDAYFSAVGVILVGSLMKNFFEEFAWRGYLTPRLEAAKVHPLLNHLIVGVLWWSWHLPYYYYFLDRTTLENSIGTSIPVFLILGLFSILSTSILFGELRLLSNSVWPVFVLHEVVNGLSLPLIFNGFIKLNGTAGVIFTPTNEGIITSILLSIAGWMLYQYRMKNIVS